MIAELEPGSKSVFLLMFLLQFLVSPNGRLVTSTPNGLFPAHIGFSILSQQERTTRAVGIEGHQVFQNS